MLSFLDILPALNANCRRARGERVGAAALAPITAWHPDAAGANVAYLAATAAVYFAALVAADTALASPARPRVCAGAGAAAERVREELAAEAEDEDVAAERRRVEAGGGEGDVVQVRGLWKVYPGRAGRAPTAAVRGLSFGVPMGEVFGCVGPFSFPPLPSTPHRHRRPLSHPPALSRPRPCSADVAPEPWPAGRVVGRCQSPGWRGPRAAATRA